ncbi:hypothetical protein KCV87_33455 [Actinosynnema pretiosum subsp. pretiosum]|uniref:Transcriptional regulator, LuxR family n=2 Tax=Actinosynnema TaxID=40566 RepID=C6WK85_ACTMD|nr:LuxR C-terminal-related transcriptional regulator [Actinosynnema mirum]ACU38298.1 transcriptional regulator, LuxR family [Actinosynnema mirum DSM 43827]QUF04190.1 hypothetical protein KCV87_33455 [Actinosynnema pretiosum subsp. pretiosum]
MSPDVEGDGGSELRRRFRDSLRVRAAARERSAARLGAPPSLPEGGAAPASAARNAPEPVPVPEPAPGSFDLYEWSLGRGSFTIADAARELDCDPDDVKSIVANLLSLHLVHPFHDHDGGFVPVDPVTASTSLLAPIEIELLDRRATVNRLRTDLERMSAVFRSSPFGNQRGASMDIVQDLDVVHGLLREAAANCSSEVVSMQPGGGRSARELAEARQRDLDLLDRGVRMRVLYQHTARFDPTTREHVALLSGSGAEFRTVEALFTRLIVFDRTVAFVPADDVVRGAAAVVRDPALVAFFYSCFEHAWISAKTFDAQRHAVDSIGDDLKVEIVRMLVDGAKDDAIARRLGLSVRTTRKHIAQLMQRFGAASRFQFGYQVKAHNLLP